MKKKTTTKLHAVQVMPDKVLQVTYTDGRIIAVAMNEIIDQYSAFKPLTDDNEFATVSVADWGWSLEWSCGATLDSDRIFEISLEQAGLFENVAFRRWQDRHALSLANAAEAIGLTRRTISQYRTGARPVSRTVALACKGWEHEKQAA